MVLARPLGGFTDEISLTPLKGRSERWRVNDGFAWHVGEKNSNFHVLVDAGFVYDLASVPMLARPIVPHTTAPQSSALHDWGYRYNEIWPVIAWEDGQPIYRSKPIYADRKFWDEQYRAAMLTLDVHPWRASAAYRGVRMGGWVAWNGHRKNNDKRPNA